MVVWICLCEAVTNSVIRKVIEEGAGTLDEVGRACGAGTVCGKCRRHLFVMLREYGGRPDRP
jgi:bacterioferritin-associated ferredoxin